MISFFSFFCKDNCQEFCIIYNPNYHLSFCHFQGRWVVDRTSDGSHVGSPSPSSTEAGDCMDSIPDDLLSILSEDKSGTSSTEMQSFHNHSQHEEPLTDIAGKYLVKIKEENRLTQTTMERVAQATSDLFQVTLRKLKRKVEETLKDANIDELPGLEDTFEEFNNPFEELQTKWMLREFTREKLPYVVRHK